MSSKRRSSPAELTAAEEVSGSEDLILQILLRLPVKSLLRFRSVSKQWDSLISGNEFARTHTLRNPNKVPSGVAFYDSLTSPHTLRSVSLKPTNSIPPLELYNTETKIVQSCNGLMLCLHEASPDTFIIFNPATNDSGYIPPPTRDIRKAELAGVCLAFDPSISVHYKVICVRQFDHFTYPVKIAIDVYSSEDRSWKPIDTPFNRSSYINFESATFWNGAIHWVSEQARSLRFDVDSETLSFYNMRPMNQGVRTGSCRYFGQCGDYLHFIKICDPSAQKFCVLELRKDYSKWEIKYWVSVSRLVAAFPEIVTTKRDMSGHEVPAYAFSIICVIRGLREEDGELVMTIPGKVISYNFTAKSVKALRDLPGELTKPMKFNCFSGYEFIETLAAIQP